jgi:DNA-binding response OmpR family regulator
MVETCVTARRPVPQRYRRPAAIILDLGLPGMDRLAVLGAGARTAASRQCPRDGRGSWAGSVMASRGADDYLPKPFRMEELLARLRSIVRRSAEHASSVINVEM